MPNANMNQRLMLESVDGTAKQNAERFLVGAMLREPFNLYLHLPRLNPVALSNASGGLAPVFAEILRQHSENGQFHPLTVEVKTAFPGLADLQAADPEIDLSWAIDNWEHEYKVWAEQVAYQTAAAQRHISAAAMRDALESARDTLGANGGTVSMTGADEFQQWAGDKIDGKMPDYPTKTPIASLANLIPAFRPGYMWVVAGRPGMGKTQFALNLLSGFADAGAHGLFFSVEMTAPDIYRRLLGVRHGINPEGDWSMLDRNYLKSAVAEVGAMPIAVIDNVPQLSGIESVAVSANYQRKLDYIFVDYLGLVVANGRHGNREREVASISEGLTRLAKRINCAVIALAQLSRANESRGGSKRPQLSDLRDSGGIEQDAGGVIFLHRPEYYGFEDDGNGVPMQGKAELIVAKNRNGQTGIEICCYRPARGFFDEGAVLAAPPQPITGFVQNRTETGLPF